MNSVQGHEEAIRSQVCADCIYPSGTGICGAGHTNECPLNTLLPRAVEAVKKGRSTTILDYLRTLRVGKGGQNGSTAGVISQEEALWLESALPLIAAAVEEANGQLNRSEARSKKSGT